MPCLNSIKSEIFFIPISDFVQSFLCLLFYSEIQCKNRTGYHKGHSRTYHLPESVYMIVLRTYPENDKRGVASESE